MKYITFLRDDIEVALLFPELVQHRDAAKALRPDDKILGAGFCKLPEVGRVTPCAPVCVWGESDGLKIKSRGAADAVAIHFTITLPVLVPEPSTINSQPSTSLEVA